MQKSLDHHYNSRLGLKKTSTSSCVRKTTQIQLPVLFDDVMTAKENWEWEGDARGVLQFGSNERKNLLQNAVCDINHLIRVFNQLYY